MPTATAPAPTRAIRPASQPVGTGVAWTDHQAVKDALHQAGRDNPGAYTLGIVETLIRFHKQCLDSKYNRAKAASKSGIESSVLSRLLRGIYESPSKQTKKVERFLELHERRLLIQDGGFIKTDIATKIHRACNMALVHQQVNFVFGVSHLGKSRALKEFQATKPENVFYVAAGSNRTCHAFAGQICRALGEPNPAHSFEARVAYIFANLGHSDLLIVDQLHTLFRTAPQAVHVAASMELLLEVFEETGCGMILCGTGSKSGGLQRSFRKEVETGPHREIFTHLRNRGTVHLQLADKPSKKDLDTVAASFGLASPETNPDAEKIVLAQIGEHCLGTYIEALRCASTRARKEDRAMEWQDYIDFMRSAARASS